MTALLEGFRIIDWSLYQVGPYAAVMLASLGAEVIHIEERQHGDLLRSLRRNLGLDVTLPGGRQLNFEEHNFNKKSVALDLKHPHGKEIMYRLVQKSDVFLTNFREEAIKRLGMDYLTLKTYNPKIIYASASGFGLKGPDRGIGSLDAFAQARSGAMTSGGEEGWPPAVGIPNAGDRATSMLLAFGIVAALLGRERHGIAQELHVSQLGAMVSLQGFWLMPILLLGKPFRRHNRKKTNPLYNYYQCSDGRWIMVGGLGEWYWPRFCKALGRPELEKDPRFKNEEERERFAEEAISIIDKVIATRPALEWVERFKNEDVLVSPINDLADLINDPQVIENRYIMEIEHPVLGNVKFPGFPFEFGETPAKITSPAPELGQHTEQVLVDICGFNWDEVEQLRVEGVI